MISDPCTQVSLLLWTSVSVLAAGPDGVLPLGGSDLQAGCQLVKVAPEDRQDSRCFNEPECEDVCQIVDTQVCTIIHRKECNPVTKEHCTKSDQPVCSTVYEELCESVSQPECTTGSNFPLTFSISVNIF